MEQAHTPDVNTNLSPNATDIQKPADTSAPQPDVTEESQTRPRVEENVAQPKVAQAATEEKNDQHYPPLDFNGSPNSPLSPGNMATVKSAGSVAMSFEENDAFKQRLMESTILRKKAEDDAHVLANRIALLELEEQKTMKKVEETRKKAQEIMALKNRNALIAKQKAELKREREEEEKKKHHQNKIFKEQIKIAQEQKKKELQKELKSGVEDMKKTKKGFLDSMVKYRNEELAKNQEVARGIKQTQRDMQEKKKIQIEETKEKAKVEYEKRITKEQTKRQETFVLISELEQREQDLIKKLQATQNLQKIAFEDLEKVLAAPAQEQ